MHQYNLQDMQGAFENRRPSIIGVEKEYAVLVPLVDVDGALHLLFEVRAESLRHQPGEICFPGGHMEPGESPENCAIRETAEELGISPSHIQLFGPMDYMHHQGQYAMYPFLGTISHQIVQGIRGNPCEVKEVFLVPLRFFQEQTPVLYQYDMVPAVGKDFPYDLIHKKNGYAWQPGKLEIPIYQWGGHAIWGITGRIIRSLLHTLDTYTFSQKEPS